MKRTLLALVLWGIPALSHAALPDVAALEAIGGVVQQSGGNVVGLRVDCSKFGPEQYRLIGQVNTLKSISLSGKALTDEHLAALKDLSNLESILLNVTELTDDGFRHFAAFPKLRRISLYHISRNSDNFTGAGLAHLKQVPSLERLTFAGATSGDEALAAVAQITQLKEYSAWHNWESREGIKHLLKLPNLTALKLGQRLPARDRPLTPSLDDATLATIAQIKTLEKLDIQEARLTLAGLKQLTALPNLKQLNIKTVDVSAADIEALRQLLPETKITFEPLSDEDRELLAKKLKL